MAQIYLKREDLNHTGAHKINNALGQALLCKRMGKNRIIAETGAGQHGVATVSSSNHSKRTATYSKGCSIGSQLIPVVGVCSAESAPWPYWPYTDHLTLSCVSRCGHVVVGSTYLSCLIYFGCHVEPLCSRGSSS